MGFMIGIALAVVRAAIVNFAVLPGLDTFEAFSLALVFTWCRPVL